MNEPCPRKESHAEHYWRYKDQETVNYCKGKIREKVDIFERPVDGT